MVTILKKTRNADNFLLDYKLCNEHQNLLKSTLGCLSDGDKKDFWVTEKSI